MVPYPGDLLLHLDSFVVLLRHARSGKASAYERAAQELGIDRSVLRRRLQTLKAWAGTELLHGRGQRMQPTRPGPAGRARHASWPRSPRSRPSSLVRASAWSSLAPGRSRRSSSRASSSNWSSSRVRCSSSFAARAVRRASSSCGAATSIWASCAPTLRRRRWRTSSSPKIDYGWCSRRRTPSLDAVRVARRDGGAPLCSTANLRGPGARDGSPEPLGGRPSRWTARRRL